jgi:hypothetical protein
MREIGKGFQAGSASQPRTRLEAAGFVFALSVSATQDEGTLQTQES